MKLIEIFWYILLIGVETTNHLKFLLKILFIKEIQIYLLNLLKVGSLGRFFFIFTFSESIFIKSSQSIGISVGTSNQTWVPFYSSVHRAPLVKQ